MVIKKIIFFGILLVSLGSKAQEENSKAFQFGGRLAIDYNHFTYDTAALKLSSQNIGFRHAWVEVNTVFDPRIKAKIQVGLRTNTIILFDVFMQYNSLDNRHIVRLGNVKVPMRLSSLNSNLEFMMLERTIDEYFVPVRDLGIVYIGEFADSKIGIQGGMFFKNSSKTDNFALKPSIRFSWLPIDNKNYTNQLYLGAAYADRSDQNIRFFHLSPAMKNSLYGWTDVLEPTYSVSDVYGLDLFYSYKTVYLESEYMKVRSHVNNDYDNFYSTLGIFLTGESKKIKNHYAGVVATDVLRPLNENGYGAWELGFRYSILRANENIYLDDFNEFSVGLNWYPLHKVKVMFDYTRMTKVNQVSTDLKSIAGFGTRFQVRF